MEYANESFVNFTVIFGLLMDCLWTQVIKLLHKMSQNQAIESKMSKWTYWRIHGIHFRSYIRLCKVY